MAGPLSGGEAWHNLHHADPTSARHGVLRGQIDSSARLIQLFEKFGWAQEVRWPDQRRITAKSVSPDTVAHKSLVKDAGK